MERAVERGVNVLDTSINYRNQRSERAVGAALAAAIGRGALARDEVCVTTKGGYLAFDSSVPADPREYFMTTYVRSGIVQSGDIVGSHCMTPRYLRDQLDRSRANLGLETIDVYYLHNPETQLDEVSPAKFLERIRAAFAALEEAAGGGQAAAVRDRHVERLSGPIPTERATCRFPELVRPRATWAGPITTSG